VTTALILSVISASALAAQIATLGNGKKVVLEDDGSWKYAPPPKSPEPKYVDDALAVWSSELTHHVDNFGSKEVRLVLHFENKCDHVVQSAETRVRIKDAAGKLIFDEKLENRLDLPAHKKEVNEKYFAYREGDVEGHYKRLSKAAIEGKAKIETSIVELYLDDETLLESKNAPKDDDDEE
jgi:hypothetical protein